MSDVFKDWSGYIKNGIDIYPLKIFDNDSKKYFPPRALSQQGRIKTFKYLGQLFYCVILTLGLCTGKTKARNILKFLMRVYLKFMFDNRGYIASFK